MRLKLWEALGEDSSPLDRSKQPHRRVCDVLHSASIHVENHRSVVALGTAALLAGTYIKYAFGKPQGHLVHLAYRLGFPLRGLLNKRVRRYVA